MALKGSHVKITAEHRVQIMNAATVTKMYGPLCRLSCSAYFTPNKIIWDKFVGSPIVNACVSAKYVLVCCVDGTLHFLDIRTGILVLPIVKLASAAVQCSFVSDIFLVFFSSASFNFCLHTEY